jgi:hypothetical protein
MIRSATDLHSTIVRWMTLGQDRANFVYVLTILGAATCANDVIVFLATPPAPAPFYITIRSGEWEVGLSNAAGLPAEVMIRYTLTENPSGPADITIIPIP